jgi:hypothetical protein
MKARFPFVAVFAAFLFLAAPIENSAEANTKNVTPSTPPTTATLTTACGSTVKNNCHGKCYFQYEKYICGPSVKPGGVGVHKKELQECNKSCPPGSPPL